MCKGQNTYGQIDTPLASNENVQLIATGSKHTCMSGPQQSVQCWGSAKDGLGEIPSNLQENTTVHLSMSNRHACVKSYHSVHNQLNSGLSRIDAATIITTNPHQNTNASNSVRLLLSSLESDPRSEYKSVQCWGWNRYGQLDANE